jgi:hypothetical protein
MSAIANLKKTDSCGILVCAAALKQKSCDSECLFFK